MTEQRKQEIENKVRIKWMPLGDKSVAERDMLRVIQELLKDTPVGDDALKKEYDRGYEDGKNDEIDRQYEAKKQHQMMVEKAGEVFDELDKNGGLSGPVSLPPEEGKKPAKAAKKAPEVTPAEEMPFGEVI